MIKLDIQEYCHACLDFKADVEIGRKTLVGYDCLGYEEAFISDTVVRCAHRNRCKAIKRYLEKEAQHAESSGNPSGVCGTGQAE